MKKIYLKFFPNFITELKYELKGCNQILDVGCGDSSPLKYIKYSGYKVGVDGFAPSIKKSKKAKIHDKYYLNNLKSIDKIFKSKSFDCVIGLDIIEHFEKQEGLQLINKMEKIAKKKIILFTPNGFVSQGEFNNNPYQVHKSGWNPEEMRKLGYRVKGIYGWKKLRDNFSRLKYKPSIFWRIISDLTQILTKQNPKYACALLCVKELE